MTDESGLSQIQRMQIRMIVFRATRFQLFALLLGAFALLSLTNPAEAQLFAKAKSDLAKIKADFAPDTPIQYSPSDPATKSRLFNLQTGQAGAFYNCDGEEDKRNSPYICWKTGHGDRFHRTFWDIMSLKKDKAEIAQRICDGAGACCSGGGNCQSCQSCQQPQSHEVVLPASTCGCVSCISKSDKQAAPVAATQRVVVEAPKPQSGLLSTRVPGLVQPGNVTRTVMESRGVVEEAPCDCYSCRLNRKNGTGNAQLTQKSVSAPQVTPKAASLLDRAKKSRLLR